MIKNRITLPTKALLLGAKYSIFIMPLIFCVLFLKTKYILNYSDTLRKLRIHHKALSQGPVKRYVESIFSVRLDQSDQITGACTQCGNCCLDKKCVFLEPVTDGKFECGIYNSPFRKFSNCRAFPISEEDIVRYDCPGYVINPYPVIKISIEANQ